MKQYIKRKSVRGVPSSSTNGKSVWLRSGWYWVTKGRLTPLLTKSHAVLSEVWFGVGPESPVNWKRNRTEKDRKDQKKLIKTYGPTSLS
jgi:hypothetical protein